MQKAEEQLNLKLSEKEKIFCLKDINKKQSALQKRRRPGLLLREEAPFFCAKRGIGARCSPGLHTCVSTAEKCIFFSFF